MLFRSINSKTSKGAFSVEKTRNFMGKILCYKLSAPATDKSDITIKIIDINTGYSPTVGFSIKSELGSSPTLLNAGKTTNFIYKIIHSYTSLVREANEIYIVAGYVNTSAGILFSSRTLRAASAPFLFANEAACTESLSVAVDSLIFLPP